MPATEGTDDRFRRRLAMVWLAALGWVVVFVLLREIVTTLLVLFGAVLFAVFLDGCAGWISDRSPLGRRVALTLLLVVMLGGLTGLGTVAGPSVVAQSSTLVDKVPAAWESTREYLAGQSWSRDLINGESPGKMLGGGSGVVSRLTGVFSSALGVWTSFFVGLIIGLFLAYSPRSYREGLLRLVPPRQRARAREVLAQIGKGLRWWLAGRVSSMAVVGILTYIGLLVLGVPLALTLALLAALFSFVPFLGPIFALIPAVIVMLAEEPAGVLWVLALYGAVQFVESNAITPLIQKRALSLPPALLIAGQAAFGALFGLGGVFLSTPLIVVAVIALQMLYVEGALGEEVARMGDH